ncbi:hypothetical protein H4R33_005536 [Dimargaris cristalligena]|nr:hypothetical protein H4R33_005536 [Dimargaris cristalligena]
MNSTELPYSSPTPPAKGPPRTKKLANRSKPLPPLILTQYKSHYDEPPVPSSTYKQDLERVYNHVSRILLRKDQMLLRHLSRANLSGDKAALWSHLIVTLLRRQNSPESIQAFIKYAIREKMLESYTKGKDISEVLRDNSMSTLLLVTYTQTEGRPYLLSLLQPCLQQLQSIIKDCEIDPFRVSPGMIDRNRDNLHTACRLILDTVINARQHMPTPLQDMCALIRKEVIRLWQISVSYTHQLGDHKRNRCKSYDFRIKPLPPAPDSPRGILGRGLGPSEGGRSPDEVAYHRFSQIDLPVFNPGTVSDDFASDMTKHLQSILEESANYRLSSWAASAKSERFTLESPVSLEFLSTRHSTLSPITSGGGGGVTSPGLGLGSRSSVGTNSMRLINPPESDIDFNAIEKVLGTLLFIRFVIPTMTSPESAGLPPEPSSRARRGFVLCGKVLAALCNGIEFGSKENYMGCMNPFLREARPKLRQYLQRVCTTPCSDETTKSAHKPKKRMSEVLKISPYMDMADVLAQHLESAFSMDDFDARCSLSLGENLGLGASGSQSSTLSSRLSYNSSESLDSGTTKSSHSTAANETHSEDHLLVFLYQNLEILVTDCRNRYAGGDDCWPDLQQDLRELKYSFDRFGPELEYLVFTHTGETPGRRLGHDHCNPPSDDSGHDNGYSVLTPHSGSPDFRLKSPFTSLTFPNVFRSRNRSVGSPPYS